MTDSVACVVGQAKANNPLMTDYNPTEPNSYILYIFIENKRKRTICNNKKAWFCKFYLQTVQKRSIL